MEFGLQLDGDRVWLPQARLFPYSTAVVGRWLFSSPYTLGGDVPGEVSCDVPIHDGDRWCTPPPAGDTIQLFSDWGPPFAKGLTRCGHEGYDPQPYIDSGVNDERARVCRTLPLALQPGTVIEDYNTFGHQYRIHRVLRIGDEPWARLPVWTDDVYPIYTCSLYWAIVPGYEDRGFLRAVETDEDMYIAWRTDDGRWRLLLNPGMIHIGTGC